MSEESAIDAAVKRLALALEQAARSEFLRDALGPELLKVFLAIKRQECERFNAEVTDLDYDWYLRTT